MNTYLKIVLITLLIFSFNTSVFGQTDNVDVFIQNQMQQRRIPGLQLAIVRHGKIIKTGNYGLANLQDSIAVSDKTVFTINSITKAFVGVAIVQLMEAGKLRLDAPISQYLTNIPDAWKPITVKQLLSHTSGIPDIVNEEAIVQLYLYIPMTILLSSYLPVSQALFRMVSWMSWQDSLSQIS